VLIPWTPQIATNNHIWTIVISRQLAWELDLLLAGLWRDLIVGGKERVIEVKEREERPPLPAGVTASEPKPRSRGRDPVALTLPREQITRVKLRGGTQPQKLTDAERVRWGKLDEQALIRERRRHPVKYFPRQLPEGYKASDKIRAWGQSVGLPPLPATGLTFVRPHERGKDTPETKARPVHATGLALVTGLLGGLKDKV
jgi:hypothetical protein